MSNHEFDFMKDVLIPIFGASLAIFIVFLAMELMELMGC